MPNTAQNSHWTFQLPVYGHGKEKTFLSLYLRVILGLSVTETTLLACLSMIANSVSQAAIWGIAIIIFNSLSGVSVALMNVVGYLVA